MLVKGATDVSVPTCYQQARQWLPNYKNHLDIFFTYQDFELSLCRNSALKKALLLE